jgi:trans-aconitate methyltransferase
MTYEGAKASFNTAAEQYDQARPSYPSAVIRKVIERAQLRPSAKIVEVGAGTGKASMLFAKRGYEMLCIEPGVQMSAVLRRNLQPFPKANVLTTTFEDWKPKRGAYDLLISAQAFHWIDPDIGYPKAAQALKPGGWIALFWNLPNDPEEGIYKEIQRAYRKHAPEMERRQKGKTLTQEVGEMRERMEGFAKHFPWRYVYHTSW